MSEDQLIKVLVIVVLALIARFSGKPLISFPFYLVIGCTIFTDIKAIYDGLMSIGN